MPKIPNRKISRFVNSRLPTFVKENYPVFIDFVEAYYEWMEQSGNAVDRTINLLSSVDIDNTLDEFVQHFQNEFMANIPTSVLTNKKTLLKHIKDFYQSKGTEKSYKFLFRILYNEDVNFYYPKTDILKASDGKWQVNRVIRTTTVNDTFNFISRQIQGVVSKATADVENVIQFNIGDEIVSEWYLSNISGVFFIGEKINIFMPQDTILQEVLYGIVNDFKIMNPGTKYKINDPVTLTGGDGIGASASVESVGGEETGRVLFATHSIINPFDPTIVYPPTVVLENKTAQFSVEIDPIAQTISKVRVVNGGGNYTDEPVLTFDGGDGSGATATAIVENNKVVYVTIDNPGSGYTIAPSLLATSPVFDGYYEGMQITITSGEGEGLRKTILSYSSVSNTATVDSDWEILPDITSKYSISLGQITKVRIKDFGAKYTLPPTANMVDFGDSQAVVAATVGGIGEYVGVWTTTDGFLDANKYLEDDYYYQPFSYVLKSSISINQYKDVVKKLLHPAGTIMFGEVSIESSFLIDPTYKSLERNKFWFAPYQHFGQWYKTNVGQPDEFSDPQTDYIAPNAGYWGTE